MGRLAQILFKFTVDTIKNPTYSGITNTFAISAFDSTNNNIIDSSGNNIRITANSGVLTATLSPETGTVGVKVRILDIDVHTRSSNFLIYRKD